MIAHGKTNASCEWEDCTRGASVQIRRLGPWVALCARHAVMMRASRPETRLPLKVRT